MKGRVLGYDRVADTIVVRGDDERRYGLAPGDWREARPPRKGDELDFEAEGDAAKAAFLTDTGTTVRPAGEQPPSAALARHPAFRLMMDRPVLPLAAIVFIGCFLGAYHVEGSALALVQVPELIRGFAHALADLVNASGSDPAPRLGAAVTRIAMVLLLALYVVPALAAWAFWREFNGGTDRRIAKLAGLAALVLPVLLPLVVVALVQLWVAPGIESRSARLGGGGLSAPLDSFDMLQIFGTGTVVLVLSGAGLLAAATGRLRFAAAGEPDTRPSAAPPAPAHRDYAPLRAGSQPPARSQPAPVAQPQPAPAAQPPAAAPAPRPAPRAAATTPLQHAGNGTRNGEVRESEARARPQEEPSAPSDEGAMSYLANELRAAIDASRLTPDPAAEPAPRQPRRPAPQSDLPPLSGSVWPARPKLGGSKESNGAE